MYFDTHKNQENHASTRPLILVSYRDDLKINRKLILQNISFQRFPLQRIPHYFEVENFSFKAYFYSFKQLTVRHLHTSHFKFWPI